MKNRICLVAGILSALVVVMGFSLVACGGSETESTTSTAAPTSTTAASTATTSEGGAGGAAPIEIEVPLTGAEAVPAVETAASGTFLLLVEATTEGTYNISYQLDVTDIVDAVAAHVHMAPKGTEGEVIFPLFNGPEKSGSFSGTLAEGTFDAANLTGPMAGKTIEDLAGVVLAGQTYVNVHTKAYPAGEISGQIVLNRTGTETTATGNEVTTTTGPSGY
jgi:hypothetical protein